MTIADRLHDEIDEDEDLDQVARDLMAEIVPLELYAGLRDGMPLDAILTRIFRAVSVEMNGPSTGAMKLGFARAMRR